MAKRASPTPPKQVAQLSPEQMQAGIDRLQRLLERVRQFDPQSVTDQFEIPHVEQLTAAIDDGLVRTFGPDTLEYERYKHAAYFNNGPFNYAYEVPLSEVHQSLNRSKQSNIALLQQAIETLVDRLTENPTIKKPVGGTAEVANVWSRRIFVVHGHDDAVRESVARFLERIGFQPIILHEQASRGRTVIEKVEAHSDVGFAVVLLTPDDVGGPNVSGLKPRARQNVLLELGYFIGRLGRDRVCALRRGDVELPSDFGGVIWTAYDEAGGWRTELGKELQAAGFVIDWNKLMRQ